MLLKNVKINIPNCISMLRIAATLCLLFVSTFSPVFYVVYTFTGLTDVLDGWIARKTGAVTELGARLDSIADLFFYTVMLIRIFPVLWTILPVQIWYTVGGILFLRIMSYIVAAIKFHKFASLHTYLNKLTGALVFVVPYVIRFPMAVPICWGVCAIALLASGEELLIHLCRKTYRADMKSLLEENH